MTRFLLYPILAASLAFAPATFAQTAPSAPVKVESGTYAVDPAPTQIGFAVSHLGFSTSDIAAANAWLAMDKDAEAIAAVREVVAEVAAGRAAHTMPANAPAK